MEPGLLSLAKWLNRWRPRASVDHSPAERPDAQYKENDDRDAQPQQHPADIERGQADDARNHRAAQALVRVGQRVEERDNLEPLDRAERPPGIVGAAREDQRREDQRFDVLRQDFTVRCF